MGVLDKDKQIDSKILEEMQKILYHRGPDDSGIEKFELNGNADNSLKVGIAFDRLSIRDLSANGHQPMFSGSGDVLIAFNGEIYNSEELRPELISKGYKFNGHSDTEVILCLYQEYGLEETLKKLDGMFAICLYDKKKETVYLIRDRIGEKPLYYYQKGNLFLFASEYKAFYCHPEFKACLNEDNLDEYFLFRYISDNYTLLKGVKNMTPGHYLEIKSDGIKEFEYWSIPNSDENSMSFEENKIRLSKLIEISVKRRLISDVPVGIQLSGGVDSSYLAYVVRNHFSEPLHTFGIIFDNNFYTEEKYIDEVNDKLETIGHKYMFGPEEFLDSWEKGTWFFEAPMNHEGTLALYLLNHRAKEHVTVMLCGDGPDELLGGYGRFVLTEAELRHPIINGFLRRLFSYLRGKPYRKSIVDSYVSQIQMISDESFRKIRPKGNKDSIKQVYKKRRALFDNCVGKGIHKFLNYETTTWMQDILMRSDKISMASSMELRVPYLMPELIEFSTTIPSKYLVSYSFTDAMHHTKKILKSISTDIFGEKFTYRRKKGLGCPLWDYFTHPNVKMYLEEKILPGIEKRGVVEYEYIKKLWDSREKYAANTNIGKSRDIQQVLWTVFSFEIWAQMYIDSSPMEMKIS